jgi:hypothetical protein
VIAALIPSAVGLSPCRHGRACPGLSRPSTQSRLKDEVEIAAARSKVLQAQIFRPCRAHEHSMRRTTWMAGSSHDRLAYTLPAAVAGRECAATWRSGLIVSRPVVAPSLRAAVAQLLRTPHGTLSFWRPRFAGPSLLRYQGVILAGGQSARTRRSKELSESIKTFGGARRPDPHRLDDLCRRDRPQHHSGAVRPLHHTGILPGYAWRSADDRRSASLCRS